MEIEFWNHTNEEGEEYFTAELFIHGEMVFDFSDSGHVETEKDYISAAVHVLENYREALDGVR
jgi:hypothetical protein